MNQEKVEIHCPDCKRGIKIKVKETVSELNCGVCGFFFKTQNGKVSTIFNEAKKSKSISQEETHRSEEKINTEQVKKSKETVDATAAKLNPTTSKPYVWKVLAILFCITTILLSYFLYESGSSERMKQHISTKFLDALKNPDAINLSEAKVLLEDETKSLFELFIESQLSSVDSASVETTNNFIKSLYYTNEFIEKRKFYSIKKNGDTLFFYVEYIPSKDGKSYKLKTSINEFLNGV